MEPATAQLEFSQRWIPLFSVHCSADFVQFRSTANLAYHFERNANVNPHIGGAAFVGRLVATQRRALLVDSLRLSAPPVPQGQGLFDT